MSGNVRAMSLRLPEDLAKELDLVCAVDDVAVVEAVRVAVSAYIESRRQEPHFQISLRTYIERVQRLATSDGD